MGSGKSTSTTGRQARIEEMRRADRARERRNRVLVIAASVVVVAGLVVGGTVLVRQNTDGGSGTKDSAAGDAKGGGTSGDSGHFTTGTDGVREWSGKLSRNHVTTKVAYPMHPPVGGNHNPVWLNCNGDVYRAAVPEVNAVHSLEHGAVWVTYTDKAARADVAALADKVKATPYSLMSPYADQDAPLTLSAWGHQVAVKSAKDPEVDKFFAAYVQGDQTPEPGASCTGGVMK
ncbi:DUF3105 domain-containing protein [Streptomyces sp. J2-1]|uniref:DUF3105 domain-containing protein n=1 Tax=Streptomyces corallincola TaxID=2851888 RepID=UPI001C3871F0|nr:DUF3105 domain-containing protein [Streptomyces corallincola]MBV2353671.1 DUF3105 domain-containing protein [Streptomyces corallincola]